MKSKKTNYLLLFKKVEKTLRNTLRNTGSATIWKVVPPQFRVPRKFQNFVPSQFRVPQKFQNFVPSQFRVPRNFQNFVPSRPGSAELEHGTAKFRGTRNNYADPWFPGRIVRVGSLQFTLGGGAVCTSDGAIAYLCFPDSHPKTCWMT